MVDPISAKQGLDLGKEVVRGLLWLANRRGMARSELMARQIEPLYQDMKQSHDDFRYILSRLDRLLEKLQALRADRHNDLSENLKELQEARWALHDRRDKRRSDRPRMWKAADSFREQLESSRVAEELLMSDEEMEAAIQVLSGIVNYLQREDGEYGHDLEQYFTRAGIYMHIRQNNREDANFNEGIVRVRAAINAYSAEREQQWSQIAKAFGMLSTSIKIIK